MPSLVLAEQTFDLKGIEVDIKPQQEAAIAIHCSNGRSQEVKILLRIDTPTEVDHYQPGDIRPFMLCQLLAA